MASIAAMLMIAPEQRRGVHRDDTRQHQGHPDGEQHRGEDDPAPLPGRQVPGELGFLREVTFDLVQLALFVLGQRQGLLPKPLDGFILRPELAAGPDAAIGPTLRT